MRPLGWIDVFLVWSWVLASSSLALDPYAALGLAKTADERDIKKAYRRLSKKFHPDKNPGDSKAEERFLEVGQAYEVLMDSEKRSIYDRFGEEGLKQHQAGRGGSGGAGFHDPFDIFSQFFGGGGGQRGGGGGERKGPTLVSELEVDLEDIYSGKSIDFEINRKIICPACSGSGARSQEDIQECSVCGGHGIRIVRHQLGPGIFQQMQMQCDHCSGRGKSIAHTCDKCGGARVFETVNHLVLDLDRGVAEGTEEVFEGEADESPEWATGDVIVRVRSKRKVGGFRRKESNLYWTETLALDEALLGFTRKVPHLDGHAITISRSDVTQPGFVQVIEGEGMPRHHSSGYGDLYVEYNVVLPTQVSPSLRTRIEELWGHTHTEL